MRALVVYCHPSPQSFNAAVRDLVLAKLGSAGAEVSPIETYESVMAWAEATGPAHQRLSLVQIKL